MMVGNWLLRGIVVLSILVLLAIDAAGQRAGVSSATRPILPTIEQLGSRDQHERRVAVGELVKEGPEKIETIRLAITELGQIVEMHTILTDANHAKRFPDGLAYNIAIDRAVSFFVEHQATEYLLAGLRPHSTTINGPAAEGLAQITAKTSIESKKRIAVSILSYLSDSSREVTGVDLGERRSAQKHVKGVLTQVLMHVVGEPVPNVAPIFLEDRTSEMMRRAYEWLELN